MIPPFIICKKREPWKPFNIVEKEYLNAEEEIKEISDSLQKIRQLGVIDYESQAASLNTAYANAIARGDRTGADVLLNRMNTLTKFGGSILNYPGKLEAEIIRMAQLKSKYVSAKVNVEQTIPQIFIVDRAVKAERKAVPKRSIIVVISTMSAFALTLLLLLIIDQVKSGS